MKEIIDMIVQNYLPIIVSIITTISTFCIAIRNIKDSVTKQDKTASAIRQDVKDEMARIEWSLAEVMKDNSELKKANRELKEKLMKVREP